MTSRLSIVAILASLALLVVVFELVRQRRLMERYALLWLLSASVLAALAIWSGLLEDVSSTLGIKTPSNALFLIAFGFVLLLLLHFSLIISRLTDRSALLAQRVGMLQQEVIELRDAVAAAPTDPHGDEGASTPLEA